MKKFVKEEWSKFRKMNFAEKRWYLWEYYKFHIGGVILAFFIIGSIVNTVLNPPPAEYLYIAWDGVEAREYQIYELAEGLSVIVGNPERQAVFITDYTTRGNRQFNDNMQMRFVAMLQMGAIDALITTYEGVQIAVDVEEGRRVIRDFDNVLEYLDFEIDGRIIFHDGQIMAVSLYGSPILAIYGIDSSDAYLCVIANTRRPYEIAKALEVLLYGT